MLLLHPVWAFQVLEIELALDFISENGNHSRHYIQKKIKQTSDHSKYYSLLHYYKHNVKELALYKFKCYHFKIHKKNLAYEPFDFDFPQHHT